MRWRRRPAATGRTSTGPFRAFFAVFYFSLLVLRPLSPRSGALMCSNQYAKLLSSYPGIERYAVANSWLGFCAAKNRSAVQGVARRQGSAQEKGSVPQAGSEPRQGQVKAGSRPGRVQVTARSRTSRVQVADKSHPGRRQVADRSRTGRGQVADRSQTGRRQVADRSQTGHGQVTAKDGSANHLLRSYAESTLGGWHFWS